MGLLAKKSRAEGIKSLREEHKEKDFLTPEEIRLLLRHSDEPYRTLFMTAVVTGMRRGEVMGLLWGDIDWNSNVIHVRHNLSYFQGKDGRRTWRLLSPKSTKSIRAVPMPQELREALEIYRLSAPVSPHDLVFCYKDGEPLHPDWIIKSEFHPALTRAGLRRIRFHDLRHTYAAILLTHAVNIKVIQTLLGHVSIETTLDTYGHLLPGAANEVGAKMSEVVCGPSPTEHQPIPR